MSDTEKKEKKQKPHIQLERALEIVDEAVAKSDGVLTREDKTGWIKVTNVNSKNRVYVQSRGDVREVHLSGWGEGHPGTEPYPKQNGKVKAWIDMGSEDPYAVLQDVLATLASQTAPASAPKKEKAPKAPKEVKASGGKKPLSEGDRIAMIKARAAALGMEEQLKADDTGAAVDPEGMEAVVEELEGSDPAEALVEA